MATQFQTVVRNISGIERYYGYLPKHGAILAANAEFTFNGDLQTFLQDDIRKYTAFINDITNNRIQVLSRPSSNENIGAKHAGVNRVVETGDGATHRTTLHLSAAAIATTDAGASGTFGSQELYTFPAGAVLIHGAITDLSVTAAAGIGATSTLKHSLGTAAEAANDTLDSTQANIIASTNTVLASSAGTAKGLGTTLLVGDGTTTPIKAFLNYGVADAGATANSTVTTTGTVTILWSFIGDN